MSILLYVSEKTLFFTINEFSPMQLLERQSDFSEIPQHWQRYPSECTSMDVWNSDHAYRAQSLASKKQQEPRIHFLDY